MALFPPGGEMLGHSVASPPSAKKPGCTRVAMDFGVLFPPSVGKLHPFVIAPFPKKVPAGGDFAKPARLPKSQILNLSVFLHPLAYQLFRGPTNRTLCPSERCLLLTAKYWAIPLPLLFPQKSSASPASQWTLGFCFLLPSESFTPPPLLLLPKKSRLAGILQNPFDYQNHRF